MASETIPAVEPVKVVASVLQSELDLEDGHIMLGLENWKIPPVKGLYVVLFYGPEQVVGNNNFNSTDPQTGEFIEVQSTAMLHTIEIEVMSFDSEARRRKQEVLQALASYQAQQTMERYNMRFASTPAAFVPVQTEEPSKQLNRFRTNVLVNAVYEKTKTTPYYDSLQDVELVENP